MKESSIHLKAKIERGNSYFGREVCHTLALSYT